MSQIIAALLIFGGAVIGSFAWYGYRQAHMFWKWSAVKWAKVLGIAGLVAFVGSALYYDYSGGREASKGALATCQHALNRNFKTLMTAATNAEKDACVRTISNQYPIWSAVFGLIDDFECGSTPTTSWDFRHNIAAPACNTKDVEDFSCGTIDDLNRLMGRCGLDEAK